MKSRRIYGAVDGVISRNSLGGKNRQIGTATSESFSGDRLPRVVAPSASLAKPQDAAHPAAGGLLRAEIEESLAQIDQSENAQRSRRPRRNWKTIIKRSFLMILIGVIGAGGYVGYKALVASSSIFQGNIFGLFQTQTLKQDAQGRSNILVFGTEGFSDNSDHPGANLTDSIMLISISQEKKDAFMLSLPRDLYVKHPDCPPLGTSAGKLNEVYYCASNDAKDHARGAEALRAKVSEVTGVDIQYTVHVNWAVLQQGVDAVGGVDVTIESDDPRGILDRNFDQSCNYRCYYVKYKNGEVAHLDGIHALALARARNANGGYGLSGGNFDREKNQQKIVKALREKALSTGTLTDIGKVTSLLDALGSNLRTNFQTSEIKTLVELSQKIEESSIASLTLVDEAEPLVTTGSMDGASIVRPIAGLYDYSDIVAYIRQKLSGDAIGKEAATIDVLNGSDGYGFAARKKEELALLGITVTTVGDTPTKSTYKSIQWYDLSGNTKPQTAAKLRDTLGVESSGSRVPEGVTSTSNFVIILGNGAY